jgi:hypothetical protein
MINAVDTFVIADDVQYIKDGWVNRNKIRNGSKEFLFTFSVKKDSYKKYINQRLYSEKSIQKNKEKLLVNLTHSYKKSLYFEEVFKLISDILDYENLNVAEFNTNCLETLCNYLDINTKFLISSSLDFNQNINELTPQDGVIETIKLLGSDYYINPIGGTALYSRDAFMEHEITLKFIKMNDIEYPHLGDRFIPSLSIIDVLMSNSKDKVKEFLDEYELI